MSVTELDEGWTIIRSGGPCLSFTVAHDTRDDKVGFIHHRSEGHAQCITKLASFMDAAGNFGIDMTRKFVRIAMA